MPDPRHVTKLTEIVKLLLKFEREKCVTIYHLHRFGDGRPDVVECSVSATNSKGLIPGETDSTAQDEENAIFSTTWDPTPTALRAHPGTVGLSAIFDQWAFKGGYCIERSHRDRAYGILVNARQAP